MGNIRMVLPLCIALPSHNYSLVPLDDEMHQDQQLLKVFKGNELLLKEVKGLIVGVHGN